jgi:DNA-binding phage protein
MIFWSLSGFWENNNSFKVEISMIVFKSIHNYRDFARKVVHSYRYIRDNEVNEFLTTLLKTSVGRKETVSKGAVLWRAQVGHGWEPLYQEEEHIGDIPGPFPPERMKPLQNRAREGRANPKGISYLYCSNREDTALSEVRPWIGSLISLGAFEIQRELTIINFSTVERHRPLYELAHKEPGPQERNKAVWIDIDRAFSEPVTPNDKVADYVPTQIIAEFCKKQGLDGIAYRSAFGGGHNIMLFDVKSAELIRRSLYEVNIITFDFQQASNTYHVTEFRATLLERAQKDAEFRQAMLKEGIDALLAGDLEIGKAMLRDYINMAVGFGPLAEATHIPAKSLMRMLGPKGNPRADNLFQIIQHLQAHEGIHLEVAPC